jgi:hypothetical protein
MSTIDNVTAKLNSYKRSNGQRMFYVTDAGIVLDSPVVSGNEVAAVMSDGVTETFLLNVNCFRMIRTRKVETTESWTLDE